MTAGSATAPHTHALSVVVVPYAGRDYLARCLRALAEQRGVGQPEIIVPADDSTRDVAALEREFPRVRFVRVAGRLGPAALRGAGVRASRGSIVALTEDHCIPSEDWCSGILAAHRAPHAAIGGAVEKEGDDTPLAWALYLCDYGRYMRPLAEGPAAYLTDCNVSYKRAALDSVAEAWKTEFHETAVHWALAARRETLWLSPRIVVRQQRGARFASALGERFVHGWIFAGTRVAATSIARRVASAGTAALLPALLVQRAAANVIRKRRHGGRLVRALPVMLAMTTAWSLGELVGYAAGRGPAARRAESAE
ncbi:MAG: glycosyltransferase [Gemmatimonadota bacterium]|nr:glycosyltransferase [Gemmatimonadota bacterium]